MKIVHDKEELDIYYDLILDNKDMDELDEGKMVCGSHVVSGRKIHFGIRGNWSKYDKDEEEPESWEGDD